VEKAFKSWENWEREQKKALKWDKKGLSKRVYGKRGYSHLDKKG